MSRPARRVALSLCLALAAVAGCDEDALRPPPATSSAHSGTMGGDPPYPPARPAHSGAPAASATAAPEVAGNAAFAVIARSPDPFELYPLGGALLVDAAGFLAVLGEGPVRQSPALMKGLEKGLTGRLYGAWPGNAWLAGGEGTYRWAGDHWASEKLLHEHETLLALTAWEDGAVIAAVAAPGNDMRFAVAGDKAGSVLPVPSPADAHTGGQPAEGAEGDEKQAPCKVRMKPRFVVLAGLPGGDLFAAGYGCEPLGHGEAIVERWAPRQAHGTVEALPRPEGGHHAAPRGILARSAGEVLVYGSEGVPALPYLARFDGKAWSLESAPFGAGVDTLAATEDGTLWAASGGATWKKAAAGTWEKVALPAGLVTQAVWTRGGDVWVAARQTEGKGRSMLLRTARAPHVDMVRLPPRNAMAGSLASHRRFFATSACDHVYADLGSLGPSKDATTGKPVPVPKRFPTLEPVLAGEFAALVPFVEDDGAYLHLGVQVPSREIGRKLVGAYQEKNPGSTPAVFCHDPLPAGEAPKPGAAPGGKRPQK